MVWTVLALALWVVLGGFISYYGDLQGRRWGKRRVSWFGLRPKHTAILITSLTGGLIALFSVASLMIIVPTVRDVVTHGENAIQENKRLIADEKQQQLSVKLEHDRTERESGLKQQASDKTLADRQRDVADVTRRLTDARSRLAPLQARLDALSAKVSMLLVQAKKLDARNKQLATQNLDLGHQNVEMEKANRALVTNNNKAKESNDQFYNSNVMLENEKSGLEKQKSALEKEKIALESEKSALEVQVADLTSDLVHQREQLNTQLQDLSFRISQKLNVLRQGYVILRAGVELGRISVDAHLRPEAIKKQVGSLIASASEQAKTFGAAAGENGDAAILPPQKRLTLTGYENRDEHAQLDSLAEDWSGSDTSYVVVATTLANCLAGEPANIELHRYRVIRVFAKGAEVASRTIDGHSKVDDIIKNLMAFLQKDVQKSALQAGIIPRVDPETGLSEVGVLGTGELFHLTDTVRRMRGPVVLTARAKQDVSSADRLDLTFKVTRLPSQPPTVATDY